MLRKSIIGKLFFTLSLLLLFSQGFHGYALKPSPRFRVIAFYSALNDAAHISFVHEANAWFSKMAAKHNFSYFATRDWNQLNPEVLAGYQVVVFLDSRPDSLPHREAFRQYMEGGGGFLGFHFSAFALNNSAIEENWEWYHHHFLGSGEYKGNTWRPTSALLRVETGSHPVTRRIPPVFRSAPNEWYAWKNDLRLNPDIQVLLSVDPASFPLGTGPKPHEIWYDGDYPVVWINNRFKMVYVNMGHNDIDYEHDSNRELSCTFRNRIQNRLIINALKWLGNN